MRDLYVSISGCHGTGKSSVIRELCKKNNWATLPETVIPITQEELNSQFKRQVWFYLNHKKRELLKLPKKGVKVGDRWANDIKIYNKASQKMGWLTENEAERIGQLMELADWKNPDIEIVLFASSKELRERVGKRKRKSKNKLCEGDVEFLKRVNEEFINYAKQNNGLREVHLVDTTKKSVKEVAVETEKIILEHLSSE